MTIYKIKQWAGTFDNNRSRDIKKPTWVAMPNRHDTLGFRTLLALPDGPAMYGAWCILVQVASRCKVHGVLIRDNDKPHTCDSLAIKTGLPAELIAKCLETLTRPDIDWIESQSPQEGAASPQEGAASPQEGAASPQEGAASPQEGAASPQEGAASPQVARAQKERTNDKKEEKEEKELHKRAVDDDGGGKGFLEFPKTVHAVCSRFPMADVTLIGQIVEASARAYVSIDHPRIPEPDDGVYAAAVEVAAQGSPKQNSAALFKKTVPSVIGNWAKFGRNANGSKPPDQNRSVKSIREEREKRRKELGYAS